MELKLEKKALAIFHYTSNVQKNHLENSRIQLVIHCVMLTTSREDEKGLCVNAVSCGVLFSS